MYELKEFRELVDAKPMPGRGVQPPTPETVQRCIQALLHRQFLYPHEHQHESLVSVLSEPRYQTFFRSYFAAMGFEFIHDPRSGMVGIKVPVLAKRYDYRSSRLRQDETKVLLVLRLAFEEAYRDGTQGSRGEVELDSDALVEKLIVAANADFQDKETRLYDILALFEGKGLVKVGERDPEERVRVLTIYPGIEHVTPDSYIATIENKAIEASAAADSAVREPQIHSEDERESE